ncbi:MAG TPA: adenylyl-sulfate kinase [Chthonomonadales bacterium]|nr:adenylyl-sulfate kinase [Chthonomonadales bacterium]
MQQGFILWFTGLSGSGKSTLAQAIAERLRADGLRVELLDGDEVRTNLSKGLGFSKEDRDTNIRRIGYVARLLARNGVVAITAAISPYREIRDEVRREAAADGVPFVEAYPSATLDALVERDVKGLYRKAIAGEIRNFTGVSDPYEPPLAPEVEVRTDEQTPAESVEAILAALKGLGRLP